MAEKNLLEIRKKVKSRKPKYVRQDINKKKRLRNHWRKPRGAQSKVRLRLRGKRARPETGYGSPAAVKGFSSSGKKIKFIQNPDMLAKLTAKEYDIIIDAAVGARKKMIIIQKAHEMGISIINLDAKSYVENFNRKKEQRKKSREERKLKREKPKEQAKPAEQKPSPAPEAEEGKKEAEKKELDKVLTKRQ